MAIRFGSSSGYKTRTDYRISEGELDCGETVYMFIKTIEESKSIEDEYSICSIGIVSSPNLCYESVSVKVSEEAAPKYKPVAAAMGATADTLQTMGNAGEAATELACTPIKIKSATVEITATWKDMDTVPTVDDLLAITTADGSYLLGAQVPLPTGNYIVTSRSTDQPADDFGSRTITYKMKLPYPNDTVRTAYLGAVTTYIPTFNEDVSTCEIEVQFRQGEVPMKKVTSTEYGLASIPTT